MTHESQERRLLRRVKRCECTSARVFLNGIGVCTKIGHDSTKSFFLLLVDECACHTNTCAFEPHCFGARGRHSSSSLDLAHTDIMQRGAPRGGMANRAKGENAELRADLNSQYRDPRKEAIKRVIASMTGQSPTQRVISVPW